MVMMIVLLAAADDNHEMYMKMKIARVDLPEKCHYIDTN